MSIGTVTLQQQTDKSFTHVAFHDRVSFPGDGSYPTNGTAAFAAKFQSVSIADPRGGSYPNVLPFQGRTPIFVVGHSGVYRLQYDITNDKLKVYNTTTGAEVANATDLSGTTFEALVISN